MSNGIRLEVGKKYRSSCGDVWECVSNSDSTTLPFRCKSGKRDTWFTAGGKYWIDVDKFSDDDLIEEVVDEDEILPGSIVPPEKLELAREMCRNGEPFFVTAKSNGTESGYLPARDEFELYWDNESFYVKRGPLTSEPDDPQGDVELRDDDDETHGESRQVTIKPGEEFTAGDTEKVAAAKRLQSEGVQFEVLTDEGPWRVPPWTIRFNSGDFRYRRKPEEVQSGGEGCEVTDDEPRHADDVYSMLEQIDPDAAEEPCEEYSYTLTGTQLRRELLRQVESCVCADRQNTYGDAEDNFENIADLANVVLQDKLAEPLDAADVAIFSICIKLARLIESPHHIDNWIDGAGYFICGGGIATRSKQDN